MSEKYAKPLPKRKKKRKKKIRIKQIGGATKPSRPLPRPSFKEKRIEEEDIETDDESFNLSSSSAYSSESSTEEEKSGEDELDTEVEVSDIEELDLEEAPEELVMDSLVNVEGSNFFETIRTLKGGIKIDYEKLEEMYGEDEEPEEPEELEEEKLEEEEEEGEEEDVKEAKPEEVVEDQEDETKEDEKQQQETEESLPVKKKRKAKGREKELKRKPRMTHVVTMRVEELPKHKKPVEYVLPQFEVEKFNPRTKMKILKRERLFEVNIPEKRFVNLRKNDLHELKTYKFEDIVYFEMFQTKSQQNVLALTFKGKKLPRRLIFKSKREMFRFHELCKIARPGNVVWVPELVDKNSVNIKKVELVGTVPRLMNVGGRPQCDENWDVKGTEFVVGSLFDRVLVYTVTWNIKERNLPEDEEGKKRVFSEFIRFGADLYVICIINESTQNFRDESYFDTFFQSQENCGYLRVITNCTQQGIAMYMFVKESLTRRITEVKTFRKSQKTMFSSASIRLQYNESPCSFICVFGLHRDLGKKKLAIQQILDDSYEDSHHVFLMGDMNYKIALPHSIAKSFLNKKKRDMMGTDMLREFDECSIHRKKFGALQNFKEGKIRFLPTFPVIPSGQSSSSSSTSEEEEEEEERKSKKKKKKKNNFVYIGGRELSYSGRVFIRSLPGIRSRVKNYRSSGDMCVNYSRHRPVFSVIGIDTQRCHVSHFGGRTKRRKIFKFMGIYIGGYIHSQSNPMKDPQLIIEGDWMEKNVLVTTRSGKEDGPVRNPKFSRNEIPTIRPVKHSSEYLSSVYLKITLVDQAASGSEKVKGTVMFHMKDLVEVQNEKNKSVKGIWIACPILKGSFFVGDMIGYIAMIERDFDQNEDSNQDENKKSDGDEEEEEENIEELQEVADGFEGF